jgi:hypothetical protein
MTEAAMVVTGVRDGGKAVGRNGATSCADSCVTKGEIRFAIPPALYDPPHNVEERLLSREQANEILDYFMRAREQLAASCRDWLRRVAVRLLGCAPACLTGLVAVVLSWSAAVANDVPTGLSTVWSIDHLGIARFCYDKIPAVIYPRYDVARKMTSIVKRELNGEEHIIGEFPGAPDARSLSCSQDGQTIVDLGGDDQKSLFIAKGTQTSVYLIPHFWAFSNMGLYSLISPDGKSITLPEMPTLVAGPDLLKEMIVFPDVGHEIFFMEGYAYSDVDRSTNRYGYVGGEWKVQQKIALPRNFGLSEVLRCGDHDVATLVGFDSSRFEVLDEVPASKHDWLERIGVRKLFRKYSEPISITGSYGSCAFPLRRRANLQANGLARFDASGLQLFSFPDRGVSPGGDEIIFSKDGCYVLIPGTHLLAVQSPRCQ